MATPVIWIKRISILMMLSYLILGFKVWTPRLFPEAPVFYSLPTLPGWLYFGLYGILVAFLAASFFLSKTRWILVMFCALVIFLMAFDYNRIQPYYLHILVLFCGLALMEGATDEQERDALHGIRYYFCGMYFFSGFYKFNPSFAEYIHPWFVEPFTSLLGIKHVPAFSAWIIALIELFTGIGLIFPKTRKMAVSMAIISHCFILACLGPFGQNWNFIIWPWNLGMIFLTYLLFWHLQTSLLGEWKLNKFSLFKGLMIVIAGVIPWLFLFDKCDSFFSFDLYTGKTKHGVIYLNSKEIEQLPSSIKPYVKTHRLDPTRQYLDLTYWGFGEMNTLPYPEDRAFHKMHRQFSLQFYGKESVGILYFYSAYSNWERSQKEKQAKKENKPNQNGIP